MEWFIFAYMLESFSRETPGSYEDRFVGREIEARKYKVIIVPEGYLPVRYNNPSSNGTFISKFGHEIEHEELVGSSCFIYLDDWAGSVYILRPVEELEQAGVVMMDGPGVKWNPDEGEFTTIPKPSKHSSWNPQTKEWESGCPKCKFHLPNGGALGCFKEDRDFKLLFSPHGGQYCTCENASNCLCENCGIFYSSSESSMHTSEYNKDLRRHVYACEGDDEDEDETPE